MGEKPISGIGEEAQNLKDRVLAILPNYDDIQYYKRLTYEVNPFIEGKANNKTLDTLLQERLEAALFSPETNPSSKMAKGFTSLNDKDFEAKTDNVELIKLKRSYDALVPKHVAKMKAKKLSPEVAKENLRAEFLDDEENKKSFERLKVQIIAKNSENMTNRVDGAKADQRANLQPSDIFLRDELNFCTPVIIGNRDPNRGHNDPAFQNPKHRDYYLQVALLNDPSKDKHDIILLDDISKAPKGQFVPYNKLFETATAYYAGNSSKHELLGNAEAKILGDACIEHIQQQVMNQKSFVDKRRQSMLGDALNENLAEEYKTFITQIAALETVPNKKPLEVDAAKYGIKDKDVIKFLNDTYRDAQEKVDDHKFQDIKEARMHVINESLLNNPKGTNSLLELFKQRSDQAGQIDAGLKAIMENNKLDKLQQFSLAATVPATVPAPQGRNKKPAPKKPAKGQLQLPEDTKLMAIQSLSESLMLDMIGGTGGDIEKMQLEIDKHYSKQAALGIPKQNILYAQNEPKNTPQTAEEAGKSLANSLADYRKSTAKNQLPRKPTSDISMV